MCYKNDANSNNPLFMSSKQVLLQIWDTMQRLQTDFCLVQELTAFYTSNQWLNAQNVLDIGTGNGYYLTKIANYFPDKTYLGIDNSHEFIDIAMKTKTSNQIQYKQGNAFEVEGSYDYVIMRLLLQHLSDIPALLDHIAKITKPGSSALIIDAYNSTRLFQPPLPIFCDFFTAFSKHELMNGRDRNVNKSLNRALRTNSSWRLGNTLQLLIPSTIPGNLDLMRKNYALLIDLVQEVGQVDYDFVNVRKEWEWWCGLEHTYTQVGLILTRIDRI